MAGISVLSRVLRTFLRRYACLTRSQQGAGSLPRSAPSGHGRSDLSVTQLPRPAGPRAMDLARCQLRDGVIVAVKVFPGPAIAALRTAVDPPQLTSGGIV